MSSRTEDERRADLEVVYREHHEFVWRTLYHFGLHRDAVNDALQEVFIVVHRRLSDFDGRSSIKNWLYGIARRVAADMRKKDRRATHKLQLIRSLPDGGRASVHDRLSATELGRLVLDSMHDDQREVFILSELEGMTAPEVAAAASIKLNTVYSRLRTVRALFAKAVAREEAKRQRPRSR